MKKLLFLLAIATVLLSSCSDKIDPVSDPKSATTIEIQEMPKDTMLVIVDNDRITLLNKDTNLVEYSHQNDTSVGLLFGFVWGIFLTGMIYSIFAD
jgi:hypothetical protein